MKMWEVYVCGILKYKGFFGKEKTETRASGFPIRVMAETKEEAMKLAEEKYNYFQENTDSPWRFNRVDYLNNWDSWSVKHAMETLNGKEFAEYAEQNGLTSLFN